MDCIDIKRANGYNKGMVQLEDTTYADLQSRAQKSTELEDEILRLKAENQWYREQIGLAAKRLYGSSSERMPAGREGSLFNEAEQEAMPEAPEPVSLVAAHVRRKKAKGQRELMLGGLEVEVIEYELPEDQRVCPQCGGQLHRMGEEERVEVKITPPQVTVVRHVRDKCTCRDCAQNAIKTPVIVAPMPPAAFPGSLASPSAVAYIMYEKFVQGCPLYRQEQDFERLGFPLSRQTMANWMIAGAKWLDFVYLRLLALLLQQNIAHADETKIQVLHEPGRAAQQQSYMWLYCTGRGSIPIFLYDYQPTRGREHPARFLKGFIGRLHVDGYSAYEKLPGITLSGCWAHARRKFVDAIKLLPAEQRAKGGTKSHDGLAFCDKLFEIERDLHDVTPQERRIGREQRSKPVVEALRTWLELNKPRVIPKSPIGVAVRYCLGQWNKLTAFLADGRLEIDNNRAERAIHPFVTGRKNWLFANTPDGADASATIYSIVETAKANDLNPLTYLTFLFEQLPSIDLSDKNQIDGLLPWQPSVQTQCRIPAKPTE